MSTANPAPRRHALNLPAGSVRATHLLAVTFILGLLLIVPGRDGNPLALPPYLI
jgi:hypothetical protein